MIDLQTATQAACDKVGILYQNFPADGNWHVTDATDKPPGNGNGRIRPFSDGTGGMVQNWGTMDESELFFIDSGVKLDPAAQAERNCRIKAERDQADKELAESRKKAASTAKAVIGAAQPPADNPYLTRKLVEPTATLREIELDALIQAIGYHPSAKGKSFAAGKILVAPVRNHQGVTTIEMIDCNGLKAGLAGGQKKGGFWSTGKLPEGDGLDTTILISEGVATALSNHMATGHTSIAALSCGNLKPAAEFFRNQYPVAKIVIVSDIGRGEQQAVEAARSINGEVTRPTLPEGSTGSDTNDLHVECGLEAVKTCVESAAPVEPAPADGGLVGMDDSALSAREETTVAHDDDATLITDQRLKYYFSAAYKHSVRHVPGIGWHQWDGSRWCTDMPGGLYPYIDRMQRKLLRESKQLPEHERLTRRKALIGIESHTRQTTLIQACQHVPDLITPADQLDMNPMLLNCQNGTIDLTTAALKKHDPADRITRIVNIKYDPHAKCPTFLKFIFWAMCQSAELVSYLQRFIGYCLTGLTSEQILNFWYGTGGNGKTTLMNVVQWLLCDYATTADTSLIMQGDSGSTDNNRLYMLATLRGARLVTLSEVNDGQKLDEAAIKSFTGGDIITARQIYQAGFSYVPQAKLIGFGNYKPHVRGTDHGIWRRIHLVPFGAVISDADKDPMLADKLRAELPGILAWAVRGCIEWQKAGLNPPAAILDAVKEYRQAEDVFQSWLNECCSLAELKRTPASELMTSFREYSGWRGMSDRKFGELLRGRNFQKVRSNGIHWIGISLENGTLEPCTPFSGKSYEKKNIESLGKTPLMVPTFQMELPEEITLEEGDFL